MKRVHKQQLRSRLSLSAFVCGCVALVGGLLMPGCVQVRAQDAEQSTTSAVTPAVTPIPEFNPVQVVQPVVPQSPDTVNTTGGIINSHPRDIFNQGNTYRPPVQPSEGIDNYRVETLIESQPNLSEMNTNAGSVQYHDRHSGPFNLSVETDGVFTSNLFNDFTGTKATAGEYFDVAVPVGLQFKTPTTNFGAYFRESNTFYPSYSQLNHTSQIYSQQLEHKSSDITEWDWSVAGGRIVTLNEYLPSLISIGTTGVAQAPLSNGLRPMYNAASTLAITHRLDDRDTLLASGTAGWTEEPLNYGTPTLQEPSDSREVVGAGDVQLQRAINPLQAVGVELTNIYVKGLSPQGNSNFTSVKLTFQQAFAEHGSLHMGVGPLYSHAASILYPTENDFSYTADFGIEYQTSFARMSAGYSRIFQLGYLAPATAAHQLYAVLDRPISRSMDLTVDTRYVRAIASKTYGVGGYSDFGVSSRLGYHITPNTVAFLSGSTFRQGMAGTNLGQNDLTIGLTYTFGNPLSRSGAR